MGRFEYHGVGVICHTGTCSVCLGDYPPMSQSPGKPSGFRVYGVYGNWGFGVLGGSGLRFGETIYLETQACHKGLGFRT